MKPHSRGDAMHHVFSDIHTLLWNHVQSEPVRSIEERMSNLADTKEAIIAFTERDANMMAGVLADGRFHKMPTCSDLTEKIFEDQQRAARRDCADDGYHPIMTAVCAAIGCFTALTLFHFIF